MDVFIRFFVSLNMVRLTAYDYANGTTKETTSNVSGTTKETTKETTSNVTGTTKETTKETTRENLISAIRKNPRITVKELAALVGLTVDGVRYHIDKLRQEGILSREGSTKNGRWIIRP